jgi:hypothetical protein
MKIALFIFYIRKLCYVITMSKLACLINGTVTKSKLRRMKQKSASSKALVDLYKVWASP